MAAGARDWRARVAALPTAAEDKTKRRALFSRIDAYDHGYAPLGNVSRGLVAALGNPSDATLTRWCMPAVDRAFAAVRGGAALPAEGAVGATANCVDRREFRLLLLYLRRHAQLLEVLGDGESEGRLVSEVEFQQMAPHMAAWGVSMEVAAAEYVRIDSAGGAVGAVTFDEFAHWAIELSLNLEKDHAAATSAPSPRATSTGGSTSCSTSHPISIGEATRDSESRGPVPFDPSASPPSGRAMRKRADALAKQQAQREAAAARQAAERAQDERRLRRQRESQEKLGDFRAEKEARALEEARAREVEEATRRAAEAAKRAKENKRREEIKLKVAEHRAAAVANGTARSPKAVRSASRPFVSGGRSPPAVRSPPPTRSPRVSPPSPPARSSPARPPPAVRSPARAATARASPRANASTTQKPLPASQRSRVASTPGGWKARVAALPTAPEARAQRLALFERLNAGGDGLINGDAMRDGLVDALGSPSDAGLARWSARVIERACVTVGGVDDGAIERRDFRLLLLYLQRHVELLGVFDVSDDFGDAALSEEQFQQIAMHIGGWGVQVEDAAAEYVRMDEAGEVVLDAYAHWAIAHSLAAIKGAPLSPLPTPAATPRTAEADAAAPLVAAAGAPAVDAAARPLERMSSLARCGAGLLPSGD